MLEQFACKTRATLYGFEGFFFGSIILKSTLASVQFYPPNSLSVRGSNSQWCCKGSASCTQKRACAGVRHWQNCLPLGCSPQESRQPITSLHLTLLPASTCHPRISCQPFPTSTSFCWHIHRLALSSEHLTGADPLPSSYPRSSTSEALRCVLSTASLHLRQAARQPSPPPWTPLLFNLRWHSYHTSQLTLTSTCSYLLSTLLHLLSALLHRSGLLTEKEILKILHRLHLYSPWPGCPARVPLVRALTTTDGFTEYSEPNWLPFTFATLHPEPAPQFHLLHCWCILSEWRCFSGIPRTSDTTVSMSTHKANKSFAVVEAVLQWRRF